MECKRAEWRLLTLYKFSLCYACDTLIPNWEAAKVSFSYKEKQKKRSQNSMMQKKNASRGKQGVLSGRWSTSGTVYFALCRFVFEMDAFSFARAAGVGLLNPIWKILHATLPIHGDISLTISYQHILLTMELASLTSQHTKPKPWTPWTSQTPQEGTPVSFLNPIPYLQPTPPPPPARITPAPALQHTPLDRHLMPLARGPL